MKLWLLVAVNVGEMLDLIALGTQIGFWVHRMTLTLCAMVIVGSCKITLWAPWKRDIGAWLFGDMGYINERWSAMGIISEKWRLTVTAVSCAELLVEWSWPGTAGETGAHASVLPTTVAGMWSIPTPEAMLGGKLLDWSMRRLSSNIWIQFTLLLHLSLPCGYQKSNPRRAMTLWVGLINETTWFWTMEQLRPCDVS